MRSPPSIDASISLGWELGTREGFSGVVKAFNLANGAFTLLFVLIILSVAALVGGDFIDAIGYETDTDGEPETDWDHAIMTIEENAGTAFVIFAVGLLIIPAVAIIGYLWVNMGGMMNNMRGMSR